MGAQHGRFTVIQIDTKDISKDCNTSNYEESAQVHEYAGYGAQNMSASGGIGKTAFSVGGTYDNTALTSPAALLKGKKGTTMAIIRRVEGTGTGKPEDAFDAVLAKYAESSPVDGMVTWSAEFTIDGDVTTTTQA